MGTVDDFDPNETWQGQPYKRGVDWLSVILCILLMFGLVGMLVYAVQR